MVVIDEHGARFRRRRRRSGAAVHLRVHLLRPARLVDAAASGLHERAPPDGRAAGRRGAGRGRRGDRRARLGDARRASATPARSGIPFGEGLVKNRYVGRTFIQPDQALRERGVQAQVQRAPRTCSKASAWSSSTTRSCAARRPRKLVQMLFEAGALEVHLRVSSPPIVSPCFYGIDMADQDELIAAGRTVERGPRAAGRDLARLPVAGRAAGRRRPAGRRASAAPA